MTAVFVHLSDIHFGQEKGSGQVVINHDARRKLSEDAATVIASLPNRKASGIIVTGDIAYAGKRAEYEVAGKWLDELAAKIGCTAADIQMVPGNHDIDRDKIKGMTAMMLEAIHKDGEPKLDLFLEEAADREVLYLRFEEYRRFADAYQCPLDCTGSSSAESRVELAEGRAIRFVRLNSALTCSKDGKDHGKLLLGARQRVMTASPGEELVVLVHHPLSWCSDSADTLKYLRGRARVFISGHEHQSTVAVENVEDGCDLMMLAAGATTLPEIDNKYTHAYNVIEFDWDKAQDALAVTIHARAWNDDMKRFEADPARRGDSSQRIVLGAPNFRNAPRPNEGTATNAVATAAFAHEEIILPREADVAATSHVDETKFKNLYLRFFRDLTEGDRLRILVELDAVAGEIPGGFNHDTEGRLLRSVVRSGRFNELHDKVSKALAVYEHSRGGK